MIKYLLGTTDGDPDVGIAFGVKQWPEATNRGIFYQLPTSAYRPGAIEYWAAHHYFQNEAGDDILTILNSGASEFVGSLNIDGTFTVNGAAVGAGGGLAASVKTANYTITTDEDVGVDSSGGTFTITLKATPSAGDVAIIRDVGQSCGTNNVAIARNGSTINGAATDENLDVDNGMYMFVYDGTTWKFTPFSGPGLNEAGVVATVDALYRPAMADFIYGGYFTSTGAKSGNKFTSVFQFEREPFAGGGREALFNIRAGTYNRLVVWIHSSDYATVSRRNKIVVYSQNSAGADALVLTSLTDWADGVPHGGFLEYDGDAGTAILRIDGVSDINTGEASHTISAATLPTTSAIDYVGCRSVATDQYRGKLGYFGYMDAASLDWTDLMEPDGAAKELAMTTAWGGTPAFWQPHGSMSLNLGSRGSMGVTGGVGLWLPQFRTARGA